MYYMIFMVFSFVCTHTHILINRFSGLERGMSPDLWWHLGPGLTRCFRCSLQILRGMEWLFMIHDWSWLVTLLKAKRVAKVLNWIFWRDFVRNSAGANLWAFSTGGDDPNWAKVRHYRETQEDEGLPGCTSAWFATATEPTNGEERNIEFYRCLHGRCLDTLDVQMYGMYVYIGLSYNVFYTCTYIHCGMVWYATQCNALQWNVL